MRGHITSISVDQPTVDVTSMGGYAARMASGSQTVKLEITLDGSLTDEERQALARSLSVTIFPDMTPVSPAAMVIVDNLGGSQTSRPDGQKNNDKPMTGATQAW